MKRLSATLLATLSFLGIAGAAPGHVFPPLKPGEIAAIDSALPGKPVVAPAKPRRVLVFFRTEGFVHPSIAHGRELFAKLGDNTGAFKAELSEDMACFDAARLSQYDAVLFLNSTGLKFEDPAHRQALMDFVNSGKGIIGIHAASDNFPKWPEGQALMGGVFHSHPWTANDLVAIQLDQPKHVVNIPFGGRGFWLREEIYQFKAPVDRVTHSVFMSLDMTKPQNQRPPEKLIHADRNFPIGWLKGVGKGRVFYSSLGHNPAVYWQPEIVKHWLTGIQYALGDLDLAKFPDSPEKNPVAAPAPETPAPLQDRPSPANAKP
jgi:hypothetical protein